MLIGYARVSTDDQHLDHQRAALRAAGCHRLYEEKISGARRDRPELARLLDHLREGDVVMVTRLDRLARSTIDLLHIVDHLKATGAHFRSLADQWTDTTTAHGKLILTVLGGLAEFERELIRSRTSEGRKRAIERGVKLGRKPTLTPDQMREALDDLRNGRATQVALARRYNVSPTLINRLAKTL